MIYYEKQRINDFLATVIFCCMFMPFHYRSILHDATGNGNVSFHVAENLLNPL